MLLLFLITYFVVNALQHLKRCILFMKDATEDYIAEWQVQYIVHLNRLFLYVLFTK